MILRKEILETTWGMRKFENYLEESFHLTKAWLELKPMYLDFKS